MTHTTTPSETINQVKSFLQRYAFSYGWNNANNFQFSDDSIGIIHMISTGNYGLATDIATSVLKYKRCSEKQAYHIAKAAVEANIYSRIANYIA